MKKKKQNTAKNKPPLSNRIKKEKNYNFLLDNAEKQYKELSTKKSIENKKIKITSKKYSKKNNNDLKTKKKITLENLLNIKKKEKKNFISNKLSQLKKDEIKTQNILSSKVKKICNLKSKNNLTIKTEKISTLIPKEKHKVTLSTNSDTISSKKETLVSKCQNKNKNENIILHEEKKISSLKDEIDIKKDDKILIINNSIFDNNNNNNKINDEKQNKKVNEDKKEISTPILFLKNKKQEKINPFSNDINNAIMIRSQENNNYRQILDFSKSKKQKKPKKLRFLNVNKIIQIQKIFKGFSTRKVNQKINRLKVNLCAVELFCMLLNENFNNARKRIAFLLIKLYYHDPFDKIDNEVDFNDRLIKKLSNTFYNVKGFDLEKNK